MRKESWPFVRLEDAPKLRISSESFKRNPKNLTKMACMATGIGSIGHMPSQMVAIYGRTNTVPLKGVMFRKTPSGEAALSPAGHATSQPATDSSKSTDVSSGPALKIT